MEVLEIIVGILNGIAALLDILSWFLGSGNRRARREAKQADAEIPPRDFWMGLVLVLTPIVVVVAICLLLRIFRGH